MGNSSSGMKPGEQQKVNQLIGMGFDGRTSLEALRRSNGNVDQAIELLISSGTSSANTANNYNNGRREQAALAAERRAQNNPLTAIRQNKNSGKHSTANNNNVKKNVKGLEEKLEDLAGMLGNYPAGLDIMIYVLGTIIKNPNEQKYRELKMTNKRFGETIGQTNGVGLEYLKLLGFKQSGDWYVLGNNIDPGRLWLGKSTLEKQLETPQYQIAKESIAFDKALKESLSSASVEESERQTEYKNKIPVEPELGRAGTTRITVFLGDQVLQRRFNSDDTVIGIIMWLGGTHCSVLPKNLQDQRWELVDKTLYPPKVIDIDKVGGKTLQSQKLWPSAELIVQPSGTLEMKIKTGQPLK